MTISYETIENYVNSISSKYNGLNGKISIVKDRTLMPKAVGETEIHVSDFSITLIILKMCFANDKELFKDILFYYYWTCVNYSQYKFETTAYCVEQLVNAIAKNEDVIYGLAQSIPLDLVLLYVFGHEAYHNCFFSNEKFKERALTESKNFINEMCIDLKDIDNWMARRVMRQVLKEMDENETDEKEECACDRLSLEFVFSDVLTKISPKFSIEDVEMIVQALLKMTIMFQYDNNMTLLREGLYTLDNLRTYYSKHTRLGILRTINAGYTMQNILLEKGVDISNYINSEIIKGQKLLSGFGTFNVLKIGYSLSTNELPDIDIDKDMIYRETITNISEYINSLLLGENLSKYELE